MPATPIEFDVREIPFSLRGSWLDLSPVTALHTVKPDIHLVSHQTGMHAILRLQPWRDGAAVESTTLAAPASLTWLTTGGRIEATFESKEIVRLRGTGADLRIVDAAEVLTPFTGTYLYRDPIDGAAVFTSYETGRLYRVTSLRGQLELEGAEALGAADRAVVATGAEWEIAIEEFEAGRGASHRRQEFDAVVQQRSTEFEAYRGSLVPRGDDIDHDTSGRAAYVLWSATVQPNGFLRRESILMSKHWMDKVWSWDHCFNALAVAPHDADLALDQFLTPFDHQDDAGALPDSVTHSEVLYNYVKPPIHGWAFAKLRERINRPLSQDALLTVHRKLSRWSRFWLDHRRVPGHALPFYQHGNDSGWDNSTMFDLDRVVEAPDLAAFLVIQLEVLADLTEELGLGDGAAWRKERDHVLEALLSQLWVGESFFAKSPTSGRRSATTSLLVTLPIVLGARLPEEIRASLGRRIEQHLTPWGLATQLPGTQEYEDDGYWRGPIWAPSTALIEDGLRSAGFTDLADRVRDRFLALCDRSGFAENFDAVSGDGLRDRAYTWTASTYLLFAGAA